MELTQGSLLGDRYKVIGCLGTGESGPVFLARDCAGGDAVIALKVFNQGTFRSKRMRDQFIAGLNSATQFKTEALIQPLEFVEHSGLCALAMEYVKGRDLQSLIAERGLEIDEIAQILSAVGVEISKLHEAGAAHNDITPSHIIITDRGTLRIGGTPQRVREQSKGTFPLSLQVGKAHYKSPEFLKSGKIDPRTDIYAIGVLGLEMLERCDGAASNQRRGRLLQIIDHATQVDPNQRYQTARELVLDIEEFLGAPEAKRSNGTLFVIFCSVLLMAFLFSLPLLSAHIL